MTKRRSDCRCFFMEKFIGLSAETKAFRENRHANAKETDGMSRTILRKLSVKSPRG
ncbi:hypothetical protein BRYFOR_08113 [Marvinbryantia formatexigens DSM 14469]|uniref:Uncharacterized protein n=1 Tax=Marvinbryantia formatexigens DSM 14469 TaxID=478749 RepID=C6LHK2_9FIRM|nr:hypothetical protein BRYFOR_08113 [Marvinbryantia formatexigens DSM 14469]